MTSAVQPPDKVLVVGATGMLGRPVVDRLSADGYGVRVLTRDPESARVTTPAGEQLALAVRLGAIVEKVLGRLPTDNRCLIRSLVLVPPSARGVMVRRAPMRSARSVMVCSPQ